MLLTELKTKKCGSLSRCTPLPPPGNQTRETTLYLGTRWEHRCVSHGNWRGHRSWSPSRLPFGSRTLSFLRDNPGASASQRVLLTPLAYFLRMPVLLLLPLLLLCEIRPLLPLNYQYLLMKSCCRSRMPQESDPLLAALYLLLLRLLDFRHHETRLLGAYLSRITRHLNAKAAAPQPLQIAWSPWMARLPDNTEPHRHTRLT